MIYIIILNLEGFINTQNKYPNIPIEVKTLGLVNLISYLIYL